MRRRLLYIVVAGALVLASAHRLAQPLIGGWFGSVEVFELKQQIRATEAESSTLEQNIEFLETDEGMDLEVKKQRILVPPDEIWIRVHAEQERHDAEAPVGIGERVHGFLTGVGDSAVETIRYGWRVFRYWSGKEPCEVATADEAGQSQEAP